MTPSKLPDREAGRIVRRFRNRLGLSQREMAASIGIGQGTLSRWENYRRGMTPDACDQFIAWADKEHGVRFRMGDMMRPKRVLASDKKGAGRVKRAY